MFGWGILGIWSKSGFLGFVNHHIFTIDYSETFNADGSLSPKAVEGIQRITGFSGLENLSAAFLKQTSDNLANEIENFADVTEALAPTKHAWMLTD